MVGMAQKEGSDITVHARFSQHAWLHMVNEPMCMQMTHFIQPSISTNKSSNMSSCLSWLLGFHKNLKTQVIDWKLNENVKRFNKVSSNETSIQMSIIWATSYDWQVCTKKACVSQVLSEQWSSIFFHKSFI